MTESSKILHWIVLVHKNPLGPFNETQIIEKLATGEIRINDLAHSVSGEMKEGDLPSDWRFLWQFPEFDRRKEKSQTPPAERRRATADEAEKAKSKILTKEFKEVSSKELVERTKNAWARERELSAYQGQVAVPASRRSSFQRNRWILWPGALIIAVIILPVVLGFNPFPATDAVRPVPATAQDGAGRFISKIERGTEKDSVPPKAATTLEESHLAYENVN